MDRRNFIQQSSGAFAATALGMSGLSESVADKIRHLTPSSDELLKYAEESVIPEWLAQEDYPKPYDPIAVLEAMRERGFEVLVMFSPTHPDVHAEFMSCIADKSRPLAVNVPDFPSAVRWLHRQAAAVDEDFAKAFPVPE